MELKGEHLALRPNVQTLLPLEDFTRFWLILSLVSLMSNTSLVEYIAQTSLKWLTVAMPLLETSERLERD